ncbi:MAG TPA: DNA internalization-related competence protein ComEC/Rec2 [Verrucomicrobiae bacterium]|nr:DNA internalization-related competence protein ComEC/Rec2 [Verrucomicrobiae bacterium]
MKRPLTGLVVAYAAGIWVGSLVAWPSVILFAVAAAFLAAFLFLQRTRFSLAVLLGAVLMAGACAYREAATISSPNDITRLLEQRDQNVQLQGIIVSDTGYRAVPLNEDDAERERFELELTAVEHYGQWQPAIGRILVFVSETRDAEPLRYGDRITFSAILRVPPPMRNPGAFDWRTWLERKGIYFTATIRKVDLIHVEAHNQGNPVIALSLRLSEYLEHVLRLGLENEPQLTGALAGMVLGKRSEIPTETYADFQRTGVFHVFAINGLHVGLVTAVVLIALRLARIPRRWCAVAAVPLLILYVFATGAHPGALRALVMACVWLIGLMLVRPADSLNSLAAAALVILVWAPTQLMDGGFILSFSVVLAIVTLTPRIEALLVSRVAPDPFLPRQFVSDWRTKLSGALHRIIQLLSCSIAAWLGLLPLMATYFHLFTPVSIAANLLVIPLLGCILALGLLAALAHIVSAWLTVTLNNANGFLLSIMIRGVEWLGRLPFGHCFVQAPPLWLVWAYYGLAILLLSKRITAPRRGLAAALAVPTVGLALFLSGGHTDKVELTVLSLNDGMSVFIDAPGERTDMLVDGGGGWSGAHIVIPFLRAQGVNQLAATVLTRGDKAHAAGLDTVAGEVPIREAIYSGIASRSKYYPEWLDEMKAHKIPLRAVKAGDDLSATPDVHIRVLNPPPGIAASRSEDNALVLAVEFGPTRILLMSDVGETVEKRLLKEFRDLHAQVIVKGQHGTESSCTAEFLDAVHPDAVVQVVNLNDSHRYLEPNLRDRLAERKIALIRSDDSGAVTIQISRDKYQIHTFLK